MTHSEEIVLAIEFVSFAVQSTGSLDGLDPGQDYIQLCQTVHELQSSDWSAYGDCGNFKRKSRKRRSSKRVCPHKDMSDDGNFLWRVHVDNQPAVKKKSMLGLAG